MKASEQIAKLGQRVERLEACEAVSRLHSDNEHERNWLSVYGDVLCGLIIARRAITDEQLLPLEGVAASAASRVCGARKRGGDDE